MFYGTEDPQRDAQLIVLAELTIKMAPHAPAAMAARNAEEDTYRLAFGLVRPSYWPIVAPVACALADEWERRSEQ